MTKTNLCLAHPICSKYALLKIGKRMTIYGAGNGDDGVQLASGDHRHEYFDHFLHAASMLGYDLSEEDTFRTEDWLVYCEEVFRIPVDRFHIVRNGLKLKDSRISPYLDIPRGRVILDTKKDREDWSSVPQGKLTLMGKELEYIENDSTSGIKFLYAVASACQDVCLGLRDCKIPVGLPRQIFGIGKPPPQWRVASWFNMLVNSHRWPKYVTYKVMRECIGEEEPKYTRVKGVHRDQRHFKDEAVLETLTIPEDDPIKRFRVIKRDQWGLFPSGILDKLIMCGKLVRESKLSAHYLFHKRMCGILEQETDLFEVLRRETDEILDIPDEDLLSTIERFRNRFVNSRWTLRRTFEEDLYRPSVIDTMAKADPLRVDLDYKFLERFNRPPKPDTPYERDALRLEAWFDDNVDDILSGVGFTNWPPRDIVADDSLLELEVMNSPELCILVVTDDVKLARRIARNNLDKLIFRVSCSNWVFHSADAVKFEDRIQEMVTIRPYILIDTGALEAFMDKTGATYSMGIPVIDPLIRKWSEDVPRRAPASQAEIYSRWRPRPEITQELLAGIIEVMTPSSSQFFQRVRRTLVR